MNRFIQTDFDNGLSPYYSNYINYPLMSLIEALQPLLPRIDQLSRRIEEAKGNCRTSPHSLNKEESAAIYLYAEEHDKPTLYSKLNQALRLGDQSMVESWFGFLKLFNTAIEKLPLVKTAVWRGMHSDIAKNLKENQEIVLGSVNSCSSSLSIIKAYLRSTSVLCLIEAINGKSIRGYTHYNPEDEVLLLPGTRLRVRRSGYYSSVGQYVVHLVEICNNNPNLSLSVDKSFSSDKKSSEHDAELSDPTKKIVSTANLTVNNHLLSTSVDESKTSIESSLTTFSNDDCYEIKYKKGEKHSYNKFYKKNGDFYDGYEADSRANGDGDRTCSNGDRYTGNFKNGKMSGYGTYTRGESYQYVGNWIDGVATGKGTSVWSNGNHYEGDHYNGKITGYGIFYSDNGDKYEGSLENGKAHGRGLRIWKNGDQYEGHFKCDKKYGSGAYKYATGAEYRGNWVDDEMNGQGTFKWASGTRYVGEFKDGKRHGRGKLTYANGKVQDGRWQNDQYMG